MLLIFAYVDLFSLYRPDFQAAIEAGEVGGFAGNQLFLLGTTAYVVIPSLMVLITLIQRPRVNRIANIVLAVVYAVTIIAGALGEWSYYILVQRHRGSPACTVMASVVIRRRLSESRPRPRRWPGSRLSRQDEHQGCGAVSQVQFPSHLGQP